MHPNIYSAISDNSSAYNSPLVESGAVLMNFSSSSTVGSGLAGRIFPLFATGAAHLGQWKQWRADMSAADTLYFLSSANDATQSALTTQQIRGKKFKFEVGHLSAPTQGVADNVAKILVQFDGRPPVWISEGETVGLDFSSFTLWAYERKQSLDWSVISDGKYSGYVGDAQRSMCIFMSVE